MQVEGFELPDVQLADGEPVKLSVVGHVNEGRIEATAVEVVEPRAGFGPYSDDELKGVARDGG